jgi:hypothetical protein
MKTKFLLSLILFFSTFSVTLAQNDIHKPDEVLKHYEKYKEPTITHRLFKHSDVVNLIQKHVQQGLLKNEIIGQSVQGRSINHLTTGTGKTKVLLWSQMHGDEATATMALFDLFNFLAADDEFNQLRQYLLKNLELHFVPMLNPDGAQIWTRTNAMKIDINRDAENLATPEAKALMDLGKKLKPSFGFNLHDQSTYYAAGKKTANTATISFLAPAFNVAKDMNPVRTRAVQVISTMNSAIQTIIPNRVAKYNDTYDSRCFGDTFQGMGISAILIESGGYPLDPEKQNIRRVNFYAMLTALTSIADQSYLNANVNTYWNLPNNSNNLHDIIIRNIEMPANGTGAKIEVAINRVQKVNADFSGVNFNGQIVKTTNLDSNFAYQEIDASTLSYFPGKTKVMTKSNWENLSPRQERKLIKSGYLFVKWEDGTSPVEPIKNRMLNLTNTQQQSLPQTSTPANFILAKKNKPKYAVVNGYFINLSDRAKPLTNTMGY